MFQDVSNDGVTSEQMGPLFESLQGYYDMRDKAWRIAGCYSHPRDCGGS